MFDFGAAVSLGYTFICVTCVSHINEHANSLQFLPAVNRPIPSNMRNKFPTWLDAQKTTTTNLEIDRGKRRRD